MSTTTAATREDSGKSTRRIAPRRRPRVIDGVATPGPVESILKGIILTLACAVVILPEEAAPSASEGPSN